MKDTAQSEKGQLGEDFVNKIAFNSFLKYWCFPGPLDIIQDNKEICELLIVFDSVCIIVSVKNYDFGGDYNKYFKKTIGKANRQIIGAEKKLFGDRITLLKHPERNAEEFPKETITKTYRIIVNLNTNVKYYQTSYVYKGKQFTVMDSMAWQTSLAELNTVPDFIDYIDNRTTLFKNFPAFILPREEYDFSESDGIQLMSELDKFIYDNDGNSKLSIAKNELEQEGYFIDQLVREMIINSENGEYLAKMFFKLNRIERSIFAKRYLEYHNNISSSKLRIKFNRTHARFGSLNIVFVYFEDDLPKNELDDLVELSLFHFSYLHDFQCGEIGLLGVSNSFNNFIFGYMQGNVSMSKLEIEELENDFKYIDWKIKTRPNPQ